VEGSFQGHTIGPLDARVSVIVENDGGVDVGKSVTCIRDTAREIAKVNDFLRGCISGAYLGLTGAKGRAFLTFAKPANRTSVFEDDLTTTNNFTLTINSNYYTVVLLYSSNKFFL
jgi:hypothetical protein